MALALEGPRAFSSPTVISRTCWHVTASSCGVGSYRCQPPAQQRRPRGCGGSGGRRALQAPSVGRARQRRGSLHVSAASSSPYVPYSWDPDNYYRVGLQMVQTGAALGGVGIQQGHFILMRTTEDELIVDAERCLVMSVGGDTLAGVAQLAQGLSTGAAGGRPLSLDLLWQVLQRGQEISKRTWGILRVAVVELRGMTFVGRVFFGDKSTGQVAWDCDCRPSDACWLALKSKAPIYVHKAVWEDSAVALRGGGTPGDPFQMPDLSDVEQADPLSTTAIMTTPRDIDPEPLKRLKMEMRVALKDEDYTAAARIRDHPWMRLHLSGLQARQKGDWLEAEQFDRQLEGLISDHEEQEQEQLGQGQDRGSSGSGSPQSAAAAEERAATAAEEEQLRRRRRQEDRGGGI